MICEKKDCFGCFSCVNICPMGCIEMVEDEWGYIYPKIDMKKCIGCNLCKKHCPALHKQEFVTPKRVYASWDLDTNGRKSSSSGGVASVFSKVIIENEGFVFGSTIEKDLTVHHIEIKDIKDIERLKGSKYVHSYIMNTYYEAKKRLLESKEVLFIGTPCQIAGLKEFLGKPYKNLYTIDVVCHGVPSQKMLRDELGLSTIDKITFRDETGYNLKVYDENGKIIKNENKNDSTYLIAFLKGLSIRDNCYQCPFAQRQRISDITIGDFWGLRDLKTAKKEMDKGISEVLINTKQGENLLNRCKGLIFLEERELDEAINGNDQLRAPYAKHENRHKFLSLYKDGEFKRSVRVSMKKEIIKYKIKKGITKIPYLKKKIRD